MKQGSAREKQPGRGRAEPDDAAREGAEKSHLWRCVTQIYAMMVCAGAQGGHCFADPLTEAKIKQESSIKAH
jgi:hypothetical protein